MPIVLAQTLSVEVQGECAVWLKYWQVPATWTLASGVPAVPIVVVGGGL